MTAPAASGPIAMPSALRPMNRLMALGACSAGKRSITRASVSGPTAAFARPSSARATASWPTEAENAASADAPTMPAQPQTSTRRRPYVSPSRPPSSMNAPKSSLLSVITSCMAACVAFRSAVASRRPSDRAPPLTSLDRPARTQAPKAIQRTRDARSDGSDVLDMGRLHRDPQGPRLTAHQRDHRNPPLDSPEAVRDAFRAQALQRVGVDLGQPQSRVEL